MDKITNKVNKLAGKQSATLDTSTTNPELNAHLIALLIEAEKKASAVIEVSKKQKAAGLKKARDESTAEIELYRKLLESEFQRKTREHINSRDTDATQIERDTELRKATLGKLFKENSINTLGLVFDTVVNIKLESHQNFK